MKTPLEKTLEWVSKYLEKEKEKYQDGLKNKYFEWEDIYNKLKELEKRG